MVQGGEFLPNCQRRKEPMQRALRTTKQDLPESLTPLTGVSLAWLFLHRRKRPGEQLAARILSFPEPPLWAFLSWPVYVGASSTPTFLEQEALKGR